MRRVLKYISIVVVLIVTAAVAYGAKGYLDAISDADGLRQRANALIVQQRNGESLGNERLTMLLLVQDPAFADHLGVDFTTAGAGATAISQSVSKRLAFDQFKPGIGKIRQTGYALGLERQLDKAQILSLWLDTVEMGRGPEGWMTGFFFASDAIYLRKPSALSDNEYLRLLAVLIAPGSYNLRGNDPDLNERVNRIERLIANQCAPLNHRDVWLDGCR